MEILARLLNLGNEWHVHSFEIDRVSNRIDIIIGHGPAKKSLFFRRPEVGGVETVTIRHLPIAGLRTFLTVPRLDTVETDKVWAPLGSRLTNEMEAFLIDVLNNTRSGKAAAKIAGVSISDVREVSQRTGAGVHYAASGLVNTVSVTSSELSVPERDYVDSDLFELVEDPDIPSETHENWQRIVNEELVLPSNTIALQMLLQRIRRNLVSHPSETTRMNSVKLLRQYFIRNRDKHQLDLKIIAGKLKQHKDKADDESILEKTGFPSDIAIWRNIINGNFKIKTSDLATQMIIEQTQKLVEQGRDETSHHVAEKILRRFFAKHKYRLRNEIRQIMGIQMVDVSDGGEMAVVIPSENAPCWQKLIDGQLEIKTDAIGLQMMIERIKRSTVGREDGSKILRQYFVRHQPALRNEILQLSNTDETVVETRVG